MTTDKELNEARQEVEHAVQKWLRVSRDNNANFFMQDYVLIVASENMEPGQENMTHMNFFNRLGMPTYGVVGLLKTAIHYWLVGERNS